MILQSLSYLLRQGPLQISHEKEGKTNGSDGSKSHGSHRSNRDDTVRDGILLDTLDRKGGRHKYHSSFGSDRHNDQYCYHTYRRSDRGYFLDQFKKAKPPTFYGEMKKLQGAEAWLLGMRKFFRLHDYS